MGVLRCPAGRGEGGERKPPEWEGEGVRHSSPKLVIIAPSFDRLLRIYTISRFTSSIFLLKIGTFFWLLVKWNGFGRLVWYLWKFGLVTYEAIGWKGAELCLCLFSLELSDSIWGGVYVCHSVRGAQCHERPGAGRVSVHRLFIFRCALLLLKASLLQYASFSHWIYTYLKLKPFYQCTVSEVCSISDISCGEK